MACPFFMPTEKYVAAWPRRPRLPLGDGWAGHCTAPGHQGALPNDHELKEFCNLGYAKHCPRLPAKRLWDAVRFSVSGERANKVAIYFVCETDHRPGEHGALEFDISSNSWTVPHRDARVQKMAQCYLEAYLVRKQMAVHPGRPSS